MTHRPPPHRRRFRRAARLGAVTLALLAVATALAIAFAQADAAPPLPDDVARVHYQRPDGDYAGWVLHVWEDTTESVTWAAGLPVTGQDAYGAYWDVGLADGAARVGFIVHKGDEKDPGPDQFLVLATHGREIWLVSGSDRIYTAPPLAPPAEGVARVHYARPDGAYDGWTLHVWEDTLETVTWDAGLPITGFDDFGAYWDVRLAEGAARLGFIVHKGDEKDPGPDQFLDLAVLGNEAWIVSGSTTVFGARPDVRAAGGGDLRARRAHWVARDLILWDVGVPLAGATYRLHHADAGGLAIEDGAVTGGAAVGLALEPDGPSAEVLARFPHLAGHDRAARARGRARVGADAAPRPGGRLDERRRRRRARRHRASDRRRARRPVRHRRAAGRPLGRATSRPSRSGRPPPASCAWCSSTATPSAWCPCGATIGTGVWFVAGDADWRGLDYLFEVEVYAPTTDRIETNRVTDPYSVSLRANSARSQFVDLDDPALMPDGWTTWVKPAFSDPVDAVVYELHVRDFSATDATVPAELRGSYAAFGLEGTAGVAHLTALADAGVTHLHLLPTFDLATIDEDRSTWLEPDLGPDGRPASAVAAQQAIEAVRDRDGFNWGYDPWHYLVPEGSYALDPDGPARVREFRELVMALDRMGLRVVVDVVFNHTNAAGQSAKSVLDRIVPGYYHRLDEAGNVTTSTCCANTATEHAMMERLMLDAVALWARAYKVDGYRFDLMGHHMVVNMQNVRAVLDALTAEADGTHGASLLLYGEGWDFGEVAQNARGVNATQANLAGSGIGTFSDRLRDAVRGGGPFDAGEALVRTARVRDRPRHPAEREHGAPRPGRAGRRRAARRRPGARRPGRQPRGRDLRRRGRRPRARRRGRLQRPTGRVRPRPAGPRRVRVEARQPDALGHRGVQAAARPADRRTGARPRPRALHGPVRPRDAVPARRQRPAALEEPRSQQLRRRRRLQRDRLDRRHHDHGARPPARRRQPRIVGRHARAAREPAPPARLPTTRRSPRRRCRTCCACAPARRSSASAPPTTCSVGSRSTTPAPRRSRA